MDSRHVILEMYGIIYQPYTQGGGRLPVPLLASDANEDIQRGPPCEKRG